MKGYEQTNRGLDAMIFTNSAKRTHKKNLVKYIYRGGIRL